MCDGPRQPVNVRARRALWAVIAGIVLVYFVADAVKFQTAMRERKPTLKRWLPYAAELGGDERLYERHPDYLYPPFFLVLLRPLTHVSPAAAAMIWQLSKYVCTVLIFAAAWGALARAGPLPDWVRVASIVVCARFIHSDLRHGNVNLFIAALVTGAAWLFVTNRRFAAGLAVAAAAAIKVTPALWIAWFAYKRQWRALAGAVAGLLIAIEVVPLLVLPARLNHELLRAWHGHVIRSFAEEGRVDSVGMNQSLTAVTNRLLGWSGLPPEERRVTVWPLGDAAIRWIQRGAAVALLAAGAWACRGAASGAIPLRGVEALAIAVEWSVISPITLALSGYTWTGHFCLLILPIATLLSTLTGARRTWVSAAFTLAACAIFMFATDVLTPAVREHASQLGVPLVGVMCVLAGLMAVRERLRRAGRVGGVGGRQE